MTAKEIINRVRQNPLNDFDAANPDTFLNWTLDELVQSLNESVDEVCKETLCLTDSDTPGACIFYVGIHGDWYGQGTNPATIKTLSDIQYWNNQNFLTLKARDNITMTACVQQAISTFCMYLVSVDGSFNVAITKGVDSITATGMVIPDTPIGNTPIGLLSIQTDGTHPFVSGTTSLNAVGITATFLFSSSILTMNEKVVRVSIGMLDNVELPVEVRDIYWMNSNITGWRRSDVGTPRFLVQGQDTDKYTIWPPAQYPDRLVLTVKRRPIAVITSANYATVSPEIRAQYHDRLFSGIAYRCFGKKALDSFDEEKVINYQAKWKEDIEYIKREELRMNQGNETNYCQGACV